MPELPQGGHELTLRVRNGRNEPAAAAINLDQALWERVLSRASGAPMADDATFLRSQAAQCRRLANMVNTEDVVETLLRMAAEYEQRAQESEAEAAGPSG